MPKITQRERWNRDVLTALRLHELTDSEAHALLMRPGSELTELERAGGVDALLELSAEEADWLS